MIRIVKTQSNVNYQKGQDIVKRVTSFVKPAPPNTELKKRKLIVKTE